MSQQSTISTGRAFRIAGLVIQEVASQPCLRVEQYLRQQPITCGCARCLIDNVGMTSEMIYARMSRAYGPTRA